MYVYYFKFKIININLGTGNEIEMYEYSNKNLKLLRTVEVFSIRKSTVYGVTQKDGIFLIKKIILFLGYLYCYGEKEFALIDLMGNKNENVQAMCFEDWISILLPLEDLKVFWKNFFIKLYLGSSTLWFKLLKFT